MLRISPGPSRGRVLPCLLPCFFIVLGLVGSAPTVRAASDIFGGAQYIVTPSVKTGVILDDNVYGSGEEDVIGTLIGRIEMKRLSPKTSITAAGELDLQVYTEHEQYNRLNQRLKLDIQHNLSEATALGLNGEFIFDQDYEYADDDYTEVEDKIDRITFSASPFVHFALDETNSLRLQPSFSRRDLLDDGYTDSTTYGFSLSWFHKRSEQTMFSVTPGISHTVLDFPGEDEGFYRVARVLLGIDYQMAEDKSVSFKAGPSYVQSEIPRNGEEMDSNNWGFLANIEFKWRLSEVFDVKAAYDREISHEVDGDRVTTDTLGLEGYYRIWENLGFSLRTWASHQVVEDAYLNSHGDYEDRERITYHVRPSLIYRFMEDMDMRLSYHYTLIDDMDNDRTSEANRVYFEVTYKIPMDAN